MFKDAEIKGTPKTATIIKDVTGFFICIQCNDVPKKFDSESQTIGLDMGIANFCADSNGGFISNPRGTGKRRIHPSCGFWLVDGEIRS